MMRRLTIMMAVVLSVGAAAWGQSSNERKLAVRPAGGTGGRLANYYPKLHALCVGINDYAQGEIPDLQYAEADARDFAGVLREKFGFQDVTVLAGKDASREGILAAMQALAERAGGEDGVVIYFSGHGQTVKLSRGGERGFLIPQDARVNFADLTDPWPYERSCISMDEVRKWRLYLPARHVMIIADACYSGLLATERAFPAQISDALTAPVCQVLTAGRAGQKSRELPEYGHGAFTHKMLEALQSGVADLNKDGYVRASELGVWMKDHAFLEGQSPQAQVMDGEGDFILVPRGGAGSNEDNATPAAAATPDARNLPF